MTIQLPPSSDTSALTNAIETATATNQSLVLLPGVHLTKPGYELTIPIGPNGLHLSGTSDALIQRPEKSIGDNALHRTDNNYGLFLVPARPLIPEPADMEWQTFQPSVGPPTEYLVMTRGTVTISGVTLDCNMGTQGLESLPKKLVEHCAMLGISGTHYDFSIPNGPRRTVYIGFEEVLLENLTLVRGGFADDIMFPPSYFRPNIGRVTVSNVTSGPRLNTFRASVAFTGLSQQIAVRDCRLDSLGFEEDTPWSEYPGPPGPFERSSCSLDQVQSRAMGFAMKGDVLTITGSGLDVHESFSINEASGAISDSHFVVAAENRRLIRLRDFHFDNCTWVLNPDVTKHVYGIVPRAAYDIAFSATFHNNSFVVEGSFQSGQLIETDRSPAPSTNGVTARFTNCTYQPGFGAGSNPRTHIAVLREHGDYTFDLSDLLGLPPEQAISAPPNSLHVVGPSVKCHIP